ncbi:fatty acid desaturase family protein [Kineosporia babensis]|uniref:Fatty acid desaturase n=1 Tax=Kineosporia babensis TaxID=499548 RepID=A0A9X1NAU2_9ACTN|nr:fatty acid desaturase [Kineosporia babensis]MCD5309633.1 fatty acid desaturase [Kineosporia babensis]
MTIITSRFERRLGKGDRDPADGVRAGGVTRRLSTRRSERHRGEPWRDWAAIGLWIHAQMLLVALISPSWPWLLLAALPLSLAFATGTLTILHDAGHRRFSRRTWPNVFAVQTAVPLGFFVQHWTLKHRVHHRSSQVYPLDEATRNTTVRMHPGIERKPVHRYQHLYAWFLYALAWVGELDSQFTYVRKGNIIGLEVPPFHVRLGQWLFEKAFWALVITPYVLLLGPGKFTLYFMVAMSVGAVQAAIVLVVGHINEGLYAPSEQPAPRDWSKHLVATTASFSTRSLPMRWLTGGMTHHLAHHLKPVAPRHQLPQLHTTVVEKVVRASGLPHVEYPTLTSATISHYRRLKELGRTDGGPPVVTGPTAAGAPAGGGQ